VIIEKNKQTNNMVSAPSRDIVKGENAIYVFNRLLRMAAETELSTWKQNQVRNFMKHDQIDEIMALTDSFGRTILDNACAAGNLRLVQLLWPMGAKLGKPQVTMAVVCSELHLAIVDYLLAHEPKLATTEVVVGTDEDSDETERLPLLNFCAKKGDERVLGVLLTYGFKTPESIANSLDREGNSPLHLVRKENIAALLLNRAGLEILGVANRRGQLPIDALLEKYSSLPSSAGNGFGSFGQTRTSTGTQIAGYEKDLKKTISLFNTLMNHAPPVSTKTPLRTVSPSFLPKNTRSPSEATLMQLPSVTSSMLRRTSSGASSLLHRTSSGAPSLPSNMLRRTSSGASSVTSTRTPIIPTRDMPKALFGHDLLSSAFSRNRAAFLQEEQRQFLKNEVAALRRQRILDLQQTEPSIEQHQKQALLALERTNPLAIMEAATRVQHQLKTSQSPTKSSSLRLPASPTGSSPSSPALNENHKRYVAAIDAAFASERRTSNALTPSMSILTSAFNKNKTSLDQHPSKDLMMSSGMSSSDEYRLRAAAATAESIYPPRFQDNELHKLLRAKYG
jgi:hypothetical protein